MAQRIGGCSVVLSSFSLVVKHTVKNKFHLPLCSVPVLGTKTEPHFPLRSGDFLQAVNDHSSCQNIKNVENGGGKIR